MNLYERDNKIANLIDKGYDERFVSDEGEFDEEGFLQCVADLQAEQNEKLENIACWVKDLLADAKALRDEEKSLAARRQAKEKKAASLKHYLQDFMEYKEMDGFETTKCRISFRKSTKLDVTDNDKVKAWAEQHDLLRYKEPELMKTEITKLLKDGEEIEGCRLIEVKNLQLK